MANSKVNVIKTIELDCAPGFLSPDAYIGSVIEGTSLEKREAVSQLFGNWTWDYSDVEDEVWKKIQSTLQRRIRRLHEVGCIRYGAWSLRTVVVRARSG